MRTLALLALTAAMTFAAGIDGKWTWGRQVGDADGKTYSHTSIFTLTNENGKLTGTVVQVSAAPWMKEITGRVIEIGDGKIDGNKFSFKVQIEIERGVRTAMYEGTVDGDQLKGTVKYRGIGITEPFQATRANPGR